MQNNKENFLDSKSLIAIFFLILSWFVWNQYMNKKYPELRKNKESLSHLNQEEKEKKKEISQKKSFIKKRHQEKTIFFKGKRMEIVFSSVGFGIKKLTLKDHKDRNQQAISFSSFEKPFFSTAFFYEKELIPFDIREEKEGFVGVFSSPEFQIVKTIQLDEEKFLLRTQIEIKTFKEKIPSGIHIFFSQVQPEEKALTGFSKIFAFYGQNLLKAFLSYESTRNKRFTWEQLKKNKENSFKNVSLVALGEKYFGKAFINKSELLPSVTFQEDKKQIKARLDYHFFHLKNQKLEYEAFLGPKSFKNLKNLTDPEIQKWLDFGFFAWLARPLLLILNWFFTWSGNWGWAIVLLTFFVRLVLLPINIKSYKSMEVMKKIQPQIKEIREKYKSDPKKMNTEVMSLMKVNKANPFGGCLPLFLQLPVFFALYRVLGESIELYQSPFLFWIKDLSLKDPYYILPVLGSVVLFFQQSLTPMNLPKEQARLLKMMPLFFSIFMLGLPSGLTLYIFVSGLFALVQQMFFVKLGPYYFKGGESVKTV